MTQDIRKIASDVRHLLQKPHRSDRLAQVYDLREIVEKLANGLVLAADRIDKLESVNGSSEIAGDRPDATQP